MLYKLADGRTQLYQWDTDVVLLFPELVDGTEVHFAVSPAVSIKRIVADGAATIPNILLQRNRSVQIFVYRENKTLDAGVIDVIGRPKPPDYVYTESEVLTWSTLTEQIKELEEASSEQNETLGEVAEQIGDLSNLDTEDKSSLVAAINEVFAKPSGGGGGGGTGTGTVNSVNGNAPDSQGNVELTAEDVGAASSEALTEQTAKLTQLSETVSNQGQAITGLEETVSQQSADIATLSSTVSEQGTNITNLSKTVSGQGTSITSLSSTVTSQGKKITALESTTSNQGKRIEALEEAPSSSPFYITMGEEATDVGEGYYKVDKTAEEIEAAYASGVEMYLKEAYNGTVLGKLPLVTRIEQDASQKIYAFIGNDYSGSSIYEVLAYLLIVSAFDYPIVQLEYKPFNKVSSINGKTPKSDGTLTLTASDIGAVSTEGFAPAAKTEDMTQAVGVDEAGKLWTLPGGGGGSSEEKSWKLIRDITLEEDTGMIAVNLDDDGNAFSCEEIFIHTNATNIADTTEALKLVVKINGNNTIINSTNFAISFTCGKTGTDGRTWTYIKSINPMIVFYGSWVTTNTVAEKPVTVTNLGVGHAGNPFAFGEKITSITLAIPVSSMSIASGSRFEIYGR